MLGIHLPQFGRHVNGIRFQADKSSEHLTKLVISFHTH